MLSRAELRRAYDHIGAWQDTQAVYEDAALDALCACADFGAAESVFEVGCGTGRFAERLFRHHLPPGAHYEGVDLSATMAHRARERLAPYADRATVRHTDGTLTFGGPDASQDRVIATYLLDLLPPDQICTFLGEAHRLLRSNGRLCLAGLTTGRTVLTGVVSKVWAAIHAVFPAWVGGCRPLRMRPFLTPRRWDVRHHEVVSAWGVPSEVLVARPQ